MRRALLAAVALALLALPATARPRPKQAPATYTSLAEHVALVKKGKLPGFYDPRNLAQPPVLSAPSVVLMDYDTGEVLYESGADTKRFPASTTKILTALLLIESTRPDDIITCTDPRVTQVEPSSLQVKPGERFRAEQLLYGFLLRSANDAGVVIAEHVAGSVAGFAQKMNTRAAELGATRTHFNNPHGLPDPNHWTTARDLALIARAAMQNPRFAAAVRTPRRTISRSVNFKDLVVTSKAKRPFYDKFPGADGIKTGYTRAAGHCFVGSATRNGQRLLAVVLGAPSNAIGDTIPLLSWGFARFAAQSVTQKGARLPSLAVRGGTKARVETIAGASLHLPIDRLAPAPVSTRTVTNALTAPVTAGQEVGKLEVLQAGQVVQTVPIQAAESVPRSQIKAAAIHPITWLVAGIGAGGLFLHQLRQSRLKEAARRRRRRAG